MKINTVLLVIIAILIVAVFYFQDKAGKLQGKIDSFKPDTVLVPSKTTITGDSVVYSTKRAPPGIVKKIYKGIEEGVSRVLGNIDETYIPDTTRAEIVETHYQQGITEFEDKHSFGRHGKLALSGSVRWPTGETRLIYNFTPPAKRWGFRPLAGILNDPFVGIEIDKGGTFSFAPLYKFSQEKDFLNRMGFYVKFNF